MGFSEQLRLLVTADTKGAVKAFDDVGRAADKNLTKSKGGLDKFGAGLTKAGVGMVTFGAVALAGLGGLAKMSEDANLSQVKLNNTLANMPKLAGESAKQFTDLATKIQGYSAADADAIVEAEALLGTFNLTAQQIKGITPLVVDYARKFGVDLPSAAVQVGKALDGNVTALKKNGVSIDEAAFKTDHYSAVQKALSSQVGGFAKAEGATFAGSLQRMKNQLGDLAEGVGGGAVDAFTDLFGAVGKAADSLDKISPGTQNAVGKFATFGAVALVAVGGVSTLIGKLIEIRKTFGQAAEGIGTFTGKLGGFKSAAGLAAGALGIGALVIEARHLTEEANRLDVGKITGALNSISDGGHKAALEMVKVSLAFNHGERDIRSIADASVPAAREFVRLAESLGAPESLIRKLNKAIAEKKAADIGGSSAQSAYTDEVDKAAGALDSETTATEAATDAAKEHTDQLHAAIDPLFAYQDALDNMAKAQGDVNAKTLEVTAAEKAYLDAVKKHGPNSKEAAAASLNLAAANGALQDAQKATSRSALNLDDAITGLRTEIKKNPAVVDEAKAKFRQIGAQAGLTKGQIDATTRSFDDLANGIRKTPSKKNIAVGTAGINAARIGLQKVKQDVIGIPGFKRVEIHFAATGTAAVSIAESKLLHRAGGGPISPKDAYVVGEHGPELFVSDKAGSIIPNGSLAHSSGGMGVGTSVTNYHIGQIVANDPKQLVEALRRYNRTNGPLPVRVH